MLTGKLNLPSMRIGNYFDILADGIHIPTNGYSHPISLNLDRYPPYPEIVIETQIPLFPDMRLDYKAVSDFRLSSLTPGPTIQLKSDDVPVVTTRETTLT